ncbi:MAG: hypothetical protein OWQ57_11895, partial [Sulfobacillus sp.]|nr:hypothetical protein [Sulfobacillus sp.]
IPVRLLYDEAQEYLSPQFLDMLALGRAYGFQTMLATRFLLELRDPALQAGIVNLCQNRIIHRIPEPAEAVKLQQQMLTIYINNITLAEEAQNLERFMADDIMRLPDHTAICLWQAKGAVQSPFIAETIDWRPEAHEEWAAYHLAHQPAFLPPVADAEFPIEDTGPDDNTSHIPADRAPAAVDPSGAFGPSPTVKAQDADFVATEEVRHSVSLAPAEWTVQEVSKRFQLSQSVVEKICAAQSCSPAVLAHVLTAHAAERPEFMLQVPGWLASHPEWFTEASIETSENVFAGSANQQPTPMHAESDTPWLLD